MLSSRETFLILGDFERVKWPRAFLMRLSRHYIRVRRNPWLMLENELLRNQKVKLNLCLHHLLALFSLLAYKFQDQGIGK